MMNEKEAKKYCKCLRDGSCQKDCRQYIDYPAEHNCTFVTVQENEDMSLRDIAERMGISYVRVFQIEKEALAKMQKKMLNE